MNKIEESIRIDKQGEKVQGKNLALPVLVRVRDDLPRVLVTCPFITSDKPACTQYSNVYQEWKWKPIGMKGLKKISEH